MKKKHESRKRMLGGFMLACIFALAMGTIFAPASVLGFLGLSAATGSAGLGTAKLSLLAPMFTIQRDPGGGDSAEKEKALSEVKKLIGEMTADTVAKVKKLETDLATAIKLETQVTGLVEKLKNLKEGSEEFKTLLEEHAELALKVKDITEKDKNAKSGIKSQVYEFIEKNAKEIENIYKKKQGFIEIEFKAADTMTTGAATNPDGIPELVGVQMAPPSNVNYRDAIIDSLVTSFATSLAAYPYTESIPKDGNFEFIGEGDEKPLTDFKIETRYAEPKKVAAHMSLTMEAVQDIPGLQSIAFDFLRKKHNLKRQQGILFGDGNGDNLEGAITVARPFSAGDLYNTVPSPNIMDIINACITDIFTTHNYEDEMPYMANIALMNPIDFYKFFMAAKDGFGHPLYPQATMFNRLTIGGVTIIPYEHAQLPANSILVADLSKYNVTNYMPYTVRIGWINDDFITNKFCIVAESRLHGFVKRLDRQAFIWDNISRIEDLIDGDLSS